VNDRIERFFDDLLSKPNRAEALSWLDESTDESPRTLGELETNESSIDLVNEAYKAGAVEVIAVDIETYPDGSQNTGRLVVVLPKQQAPRKETLRWCNKQSEQLGLPPEDEFGQTYALVMLD
jgi:hypothetical protein